VENFDEYVPKPWGHEYLAWKNKDCAIWVLHIKKNHETSFHCHTKKNTGLIVISGKVKLSLINSEYFLNRLEKLNIFRGRFHKSKAVSEHGATIIEVEAPVDKSDLVRWEDANGRTSSKYESVRKSILDLSPLYLGTEDKYESSVVFEGCKFEILRSFELDIENASFDSMFVVLKGSIHDTLDNHLVIPGDVLGQSVLLKMFKKFQIADISIFLKISTLSN
jgi:hypothetical protein